VTEVSTEGLESGFVNAKLVLDSQLKGNILDKILDDYVLLKGTVTVGERYLFFFNEDELKHLILATKRGSIIHDKSGEYPQYIGLFISNSLTYTAPPQKEEE
jgi:hypothetical protein